ncbi:MAG: helix-turn-helix domain-containing protein [Syntrophorhabdaceae bacterium]|nr:helix-turn-helix domain-containing protein [Syntrophorhabdaceae bacterium]
MNKIKRNPGERRIKAMLVMKGIKIADIAHELGLNPRTLYTVIHYYPTKKSRRVQEAIARLLNKPFEKIWPYERKHNLTISNRERIVNDN